MKKLFSFLISCCFYLLQLQATHIVGGDITYTRLTGNFFNIKLDIVRDCGGPNADFDNNTQISVLDGLSYQSVMVVSQDAFSFNSTFQQFNLSPSPCSAASSPCYERKTLSYTVELPPSPNGYWVTYGRCCRNATITNLYTPLDVGITLSAFIPDPAISNHSPVFGINMPPLVCAGDSLNIALNVTDADGDSLVYELAPVLSSGGMNMPAPINCMPNATAVSWNNGYSYTSPLGQNQLFSLNPQTGDIEVYSTQIGQFVFAVKVYEYRNGQLLGTIRKEMQLNVVNCQYSDIAPTFNYISGGYMSGDTLYFHAGLSDTAYFEMIDFQGNGQPDSNVIGNMYGDIFNGSLFQNTANAFYAAPAPSPVLCSLEMNPAFVDIGKVGKVYVTISSGSNCPVLYSLLDSFYVKILPCQGLTPAPVITDLTILNSESIDIEWVSFIIQSGFVEYELQKKEYGGTWQSIATFNSNAYWHYVDTNALYTDGTAFCYRLNSISSCSEDTSIIYGIDSCTFIPTGANNKQHSIRCYPNPVEGSKVEIDMSRFQDEDIMISLADRFGKIVWQKEIARNSNRNIVLDMEILGLRQDLYYVSVYSLKDKKKMASTILVLNKKQ